MFAPTNTAFESLPRGLLEDLLKPENKALLTKVLTYHVVSGRVLARDLRNQEKVTTVESSTVTIHLERSGRGERVFIQDQVPNTRWSEVIQADVQASNGVVHLVDKVLIPDLLMAKLTRVSNTSDSALDNIVELAASVPELSTLVTAVKAADLVETL